MLKIITLKGLTCLLYLCMRAETASNIARQNVVVLGEKTYVTDSLIYLSRTDSLPKQFKGFRRSNIDSMNVYHANLNNKWKDFKYRYIVIKRIKAN